MVDLSPRVKEKVAAKWCEALAPDLYPGEIIWAVVKAMRVSPTTAGTAITNARIIGFYPAGKTTEARIRLQARGNQIRGIDSHGTAGTTNLRIITADGEVNFGSAARSEIDFAQHYVDHLIRHGEDPAVAAAIDAAGAAAVAAEAERQRLHDAAEAEQQRLHDEKLARRDGVTVFGGAMKDKWWDAISRHSRDGEMPWFIINNGSAGRFVAFEDRLLISKTGGMTSLMAGSLGGGRETVFPFSDITNIEYNSGFANGVFEVLTPSYQGTANHDYWRSANKSRNKAADDPWTLSNCLPLPKATYQRAQPLIIELQRKIIESKRPHVVIQQPSPAAAAPNAGGLADELAKLGDMHQQGLLDDDEFKAAKMAAIAKHS